MTALEFLSTVGVNNIATGSSVIILVIMTLLEVSKVKINPWSWIAKQFGRACNKEVLERVDRLDSEVKEIKNAMTEQSLLECRIRILRFGDELCHNVLHSKEHFEQTLRDIDTYEKYSNTHPEYENNVTEATITLIKSTYLRRCENNDFI